MDFDPHFVALWVGKTTALMMMDGVKEAEVGRGFAEVDGQVRYDALVKAVEKAGYKVK